MIEVQPYNLEGEILIRKARRFGLHSYIDYGTVHQVAGYNNEPYPATAFEQDMWDALTK